MSRIVKVDGDVKGTLLTFGALWAFVTLTATNVRMSASPKSLSVCMKVNFLCIGYALIVCMHEYTRYSVIAFTFQEHSFTESLEC